MQFDHRSYSGQAFRPTPEIHFDPAAKLLFVATPWGPRSSAKKAINRMLDYYLLASEDKEVTSPFERLSCLSDAANHLRTAAYLANEELYREDNRSEYRTGVELFAASFVDTEFVLLQVGQPHVLLSRCGRPFTPLGSCIDLALDLSERETLLAPLPNQLLGLDSTVNLTINSLRVQPSDRVVLLSHSSIPAAVYATASDGQGLDQISRLLADNNPETPFWLGILDLH